MKPKSNLLQAFRNLWPKRSAVPDERDLVGKIRFEEHSAGWMLVENDVAIARLDFIRMHPPFYRFNVSYPGEVERAKELLRCSAKREPFDGVFYVNLQSPSLKVEDAFFFSRLREDGLIGIRDMRPF